VNNLSEASPVVFQNSLSGRFFKTPSPPFLFKNLPMDEILQELRALRDEVMDLKGQLGGVSRASPKPPRVPCIGMTGKGTPCRNSAQPGHEYCRMHGDRPARPVKPVRVKKEAKPKKVQPEHTHEIGETPTEPCPLCDTHGDVMDSSLPDSCFESDESIEERLRRLLESEMEEQLENGDNSN
tara:strand:+ start:194 stop:739 length:546 start_codon:yes stop_codon:yes gene_type:complete